MLNSNAPKVRSAHGVFCRVTGAASAGLLALLLISGCDQPSRPSRYSVQTGRVMTCNRDTGEMSVSVLRRSVRGEAPENIACVVTKDSEIYINDRFSLFSEIEIGDMVELLGYRDSSPSIDKFVVTYVYVERSAATRPS